MKADNLGFRKWAGPLLLSPETDSRVLKRSQGSWLMRTLSCVLLPLLQLLKTCTRTS